MSKISKNNWFKGSAIIFGIISSFIYDLIKEKPILSTLSSIFETIANFLSKILQTELKVWWILVLLIAYKLMQLIIKEYHNSIIPDLPSNIKDYKKDTFTNWIWKWEWKWRPNEKKWIIENLRAYCKNCDIKLLDKSSLFDTTMQCPKCQKKFESSHGKTDDFEGVKTVIYDNIEKNSI